jgi:adenylosuccinate lyase
LKELDNYPELLAEPIQTILRREGFDDPYNLMKELTRGKKIGRQELEEFIDALDVRGEVKQELKKLRVRDYIGIAPRICDLVLDKVEL